MPAQHHGPPPKIASRCAVFAKTDLIHAQQEGHSLGAICDGLCKGLAKNITDTLFHDTALGGKSEPAPFHGLENRPFPFVPENLGMQGAVFVDAGSLWDPSQLAELRGETEEEVRFRVGHHADHPARRVRDARDRVHGAEERHSQTRSGHWQYPASH